MTSPLSTKIEDLLLLRQEIGPCQKCSLAPGRKNLVFGEGSLNAKVVFVGEGPGEQEDLQGRPFVGRSGELLNQALAQVEWKRDEVYITNIVMCRPPGNRDPLPGERESCSPFLYRKIAVIKPRVIVCLGRISAEYLLQRPIKITREHGHVFPFPKNQGIQVIPVYHPSYVLRNRTPAILQDFYQDILKAKSLGDNEEI